ncbi:MAG: DNA mismatch repair protein MutS [Rhodobacteraceae bacterium]|nr:DNA mismatch repair protein MutS [Paracoccaceae bacterium]MBR9821267.1 DNA mismatch repair protein MutS [Paracoccaceae bacterium]
MSRRRKLRPDELELWEKVAGSAERMHPEKRPALARPVKKPEAKAKPARDPEPAPIPTFRLGERATGGAVSHDVLDPIHDRLHRAPLRMDKKTHGKMTRGKMSPEARIDLHGMTVDRAHRALTGFILRCVSEDMRLVLVITGKGRRPEDDGPIPVRHGILRHQLPHWLSLPPLNQVVLQVTSAHQKHGGTGAYYIYLRRTR